MCQAHFRCPEVPWGCQGTCQAHFRCPEVPWGCQGTFPIKLQYKSKRKIVWKCPEAAKAHFLSKLIPFLKENGLELPWGCQTTFLIKIEYKSSKQILSWITIIRKPVYFLRFYVCCLQYGITDKKTSNIPMLINTQNPYLNAHLSNITAMTCTYLMHRMISIFIKKHRNHQ